MNAKLAALSRAIVLASGWRRRLIALAAGAVSALAMAPFDLWPVLGLTFPVLVWLLDGAGAGASGLRAAFVAGWWFGFGYFVAGLFWIGNALLVEADQFGWLLPLAVTGLPAALALFTGLGAMVSRFLWTRGALRILAFTTGMLLAEWLRGHVLTGFPWNAYGYSLAAIPPVAQSASIIGLWGLTLIALAVFASPAVLTDSPETSRRRFLWPAASALLLALMALGGFYRLSSAEMRSVEGVRLRLMQPNLPQDDKFKPSAKQKVMDLYTSLSDRATRPESQGVRDVTHLIWPESAFPFFLEREADALARIADLLPPGVVLITGAARMEQRQGVQSVYNSIRVIGDDGAILATYDKVHLVPFGEYLPFQDFLESLGFQQLTKVRGGFTPGSARRALSIPRLPLVAPLICYEVIFPGRVSPEGRRPSLLLNLTNDGWFGLTPGPHQHFAQARLRAIEEGLPLVRSANTGISAVVDSYGRVIAMLPLGREGVLDATLPQSIAQPLYSRLGDIPVLFVMAFFTFLLWRSRLRGRARAHN